MNFKLIGTICLALSTATAQSPNGAQISSIALANPFASGPSSYAVALSSPAADFRNALPGIFDQAGHERRTLSGSVTPTGGTPTPFLFTREVGQRVRLDLASPARSIVTTGLNSPSITAVRLASSGSEAIDSDVLEVLADDAPEAMLFSLLGGKARFRWVGERYRDLDTVGSEVYCDIYVRTAAAATQPGSPERAKAFLFDSGTKLLRSTRYQIERDGSTVAVDVSFSNWTSMSGQMVPATIVRSENGQPVFSITVTAVSSAATQIDSLFTL